MLDKELETEFLGLKAEFAGVRVKIDDLIDKYSSLEKKYERKIKKSKKVNFKCHNCSEKYENVSDLKQHKNSGFQGDFECEECNIKFGKESQLEKHKKMHEKFECDECDKIFKKELTLERHVQAAHEDVTLFCHYFNNKKDWPYEDECIYIHEESDMCKFGQGCDRILCMFKHEPSDDNDESEDEIESESEDLNIEELKPVLGKLEEAFDKLSVSLKNHFGPLKCDLCEFEARNQNGLTMHKRAKHATK